MTDYIGSQQNAQTLTLEGDWVLARFQEIRKALTKLPGGPFQTIDASGITALDSAGALLLLDLLARPSMSEAAISGLNEAQEGLLALAQKAPREPHPPAPSTPIIQALIIRIGKASLHALDAGTDLLRFIGETSVTLVRSLLRPHRLRWNAIFRHLDETGIDAIPIIGLIAFLISLVLAYQSVGQLRQFGAEIYTINMVALSVLREMGVLLTAIMVAGRSGSAFTAEIGVMNVNEEVDAMRVIGVNPFDVLVLPRLIALMITLPLLTFLADMMGLFGGGVICYFLIGVPLTQYMQQLHQAIGDGWHFWVGIIKAPFFAFLIGVVGCMRGMQVKGSAESVGQLTTVSVVQSIFLVLLADALFSILFSKLGI